MTVMESAAITNGNHLVEAGDGGGDGGWQEVPVKSKHLTHSVNKTKSAQRQHQPTTQQSKRRPSHCENSHTGKPTSSNHVNGSNNNNNSNRNQRKMSSGDPLSNNNANNASNWRARSSGPKPQRGNETKQSKPGLDAANKRGAKALAATAFPKRPIQTATTTATSAPTAERREGRPRARNPTPKEPRERSESCDSVSSAGSSASDASDANIPAPSYPLHTVVGCPFVDCPPTIQPFVEATSLVAHLREEHSLHIENVQHMFIALEEYLTTWAKRIEDSDGMKNILTKENVDGEELYVINPDKMDEDRELRERLRRAKLDEVLRTQERERHEESHVARKCLFCKNVCEDRAVLFRHMFSEHSFNIGLPDNLVNVNEFLQLLEGKLNNLQCLYCEKTFTSPAVLRKHMRKKKHFQIGKKNRVYDRFYIVNYHLEPGKSWEEFAKNERYDSDDDRRDDSWNDWDDADPEPTMCLFDETMLPSPRDCCAHLYEAHKFDLHEIRKSKSLDFYKTVALINYIRQRTASNICFGCGDRVADIQDLVPHMEQNKCFEKVPESDSMIYTDPANLFATYPDDPLLWGFNSSPADDEEDLDDVDDGKSSVPVKVTGTEEVAKLLEAVETN